MEDEPNRQPDDIQGILSELDSILSGLGETATAPPAPPSPAPKKSEAPPPSVQTKPPVEIPAPPAKPIEPPKAVEVVKPAESPKAAEIPKPVAPPKAVEAPRPIEMPKPAAPPKPIELPKAVEIPKPVEPPKAAEAPKAVEVPKPIEPPKAAEAAKPVEPPKPAAAPNPAAAPSPVPPKPVEAAKPGDPAKVVVPAVEEIPETASKEQIRRIAYVYTFSCLAARDGFAAFLSQAARTISKKPLYLRQVMTSELTASSDPYAVFEKARDAKAVAVLAVLEGWPPAKIEGLSEACARGGLLFRSVAPGDVLKKSTAVDVIVDMMLLPGEA